LYIAEKKIFPFIMIIEVCFYSLGFHRAVTRYTRHIPTYTTVTSYAHIIMRGELVT
jgi:hypothetical protein